MSELQEIEVVIDEAGNVRIMVQGAIGSKCLDLTKDLEQLLGGEVLERQHTDEYEQISEDVDNQLGIKL